MVYRECPNHGWLETAEYVTTPGHGETICPVCETALSGYYEEVRHRREFGGPTHKPRERFLEAAGEFLSRTEGMGYSEYQDAYPIMSDWEYDPDDSE